MTSTKKTPNTPEAGSWWSGSFEGDYEAVRMTAKDGAPWDARVLDLVVLRGIVRGARRSQPPAPAVDGTQQPIRQAALSPVWVELGDRDADGNIVIHQTRLNDVWIVNWRAEPLIDEGARARGKIFGTLYARVAPRPRGCLPWWLGCLLLLLLAMLLLMLLSLPMCAAAAAQMPAPVGSVVKSARDRVVATVDDVKARIETRDARDPDGDLIGELSRRAGVAPPDLALGAGSGTGSGAGAGGTGKGAGAGKGAGDGSGAGGGGDGTGNGAGAGGGGGGGGGGDGTGDGSGKGAGGGGGNGTGEGPQDSTDKPKLDDRPKMSVDQALQEPERFFEKCGQSLVMSSDLLFDLDKDTLRPQSKPYLQKVVRVLKKSKDPRLTITVEGHADPRGTDAYNSGLSERRARRVAQWLVENKAIDASRVAAKGYGERSPVVQAPPASDLQRFNRRVEITIACPTGGGP
jgi:outer membrane protein OmpA-like peptidoglycan-associated protein